MRVQRNRTANAVLIGWRSSFAW